MVELDPSRAEHETGGQAIGAFSRAFKSLVTWTDEPSILAIFLPTMRTFATCS